jgi:hypothetical protein
MHRKSFMVAALSSLAIAQALPAQASVPDYQVRVTFRDSTGDKRAVGRLTAVTHDSLMLRVAQGDSLVAIDRRTVKRVERRRHDVSIVRAAGIGCLAVGGVLALLVSQEHDPDSPGIEKAFAVLGFVVGCGVGALGGAVIGLIGRHGWEEVRL